MKIKLFTLPNIITLGNLACGTLAVASFVVLDTATALKASMILMLGSALLDFLDGMVARLTGQYSSIGVELDSLADMVSFGLLPTIIAWQIFTLCGGEGWWGALTLLIVLFSALRLAKFNIDDDQKKDFVGLPTPANALLVASAGWFFTIYSPAEYPGWLPWVVLGCSVLLALLLISPVRMFSLKFEGFSFAANAKRYVFLAMAALMLILFGMTGIALAIILYILTSVVIWAVRRKKRV